MGVRACGRYIHSEPGNSHLTLMKRRRGPAPGAQLGLGAPLCRSLVYDPQCPRYDKLCVTTATVLIVSTTIIC